MEAEARRKAASREKAEARAQRPVAERSWRGAIAWLGGAVALAAFVGFLVSGARKDAPPIVEVQKQVPAMLQLDRDVDGFMKRIANEPSR